MQSAPDTLPRIPEGGLTSGLDWARDDHAVSVVDADGLEVHRFTIEHRGRVARLDPPAAEARGA